jgi:uncharacterized protein YdaU (DUF1376 family)
MTLEEEGAYINLLCSCWLHGSIPADPAMAARLVGKGCSATLATTVLTMFTPSSQAGRLVHERLERERLKQSDWREKSASGGRKSAELRKGASTTVQPPLANGINQKATLQSSVSSLQSSSTSASLAPTHTAPVPVAAGDEAPAADCPFPPEVARQQSARELEAESVWALYPKKKGKKEAMREVLNAIRTEGIERIRERVQAYADAVSQWSQDDRKYVPDPVRWFKRGNYDDDPKEWQRNAIPDSEKSEYNKDNAW